MPPCRACLFPALLLLVQHACLMPALAQSPAPRPTGTSHSTGPSLASSWIISSRSQSEPLASGAVWHTLTARNAAGESAEIQAVTFDSRRCTFRVLDQPTANAGGGVLSSIMRRGRAIAGVNGGFFHPDFSPLGLMITDGKKAGQMTRSSLVSGAVLVIGSEPYVIWNQEFMGTKGVSQMLQAGPRLVDAGHPLTSLNRAKTANRTFVATDGKRQWALGTVHSTTLAGLAELLATPNLLQGLKVHRAINLDGGRSTALYIRKPDGQEISRPGWSTVRNYLAVIPR